MAFSYQGKENGHDVWNEGNYYKVNLAIIRREHNVYLRNTYTGKEILLRETNSNKEAMKWARFYKSPNASEVLATNFRKRLAKVA